MNSQGRRGGDNLARWREGHVQWSKAGRSATFKQGKEVRCDEHLEQKEQASEGRTKEEEANRKSAF